MIDRYRLPAYVTGIGAKGSVIVFADRGPRVPRHDRDPTNGSATWRG